MSVEYIDRPTNSRLSIDLPSRELDGSVLYKSKLVTPIDLPSYLGLFDQTDEISMYYFQRGYEPEIKYLLEMPNTDAVAALEFLGYDYKATENYGNGKRFLTNMQRIPSMDTWNRVFQRIDSELYFSDVDSGKYTNLLAEEVYFEDSIIPISNKEPWRFHDLAIHPIGHFLISGEVVQDVMSEVNDIREQDSPREHRNKGQNSLWYAVDNFTEEIAYTFLANKIGDFDKKITSFIENIGSCLPVTEIEEFNKNYLNSKFIGRIITEMYSMAEKFEELG